MSEYDQGYRDGAMAARLGLAMMDGWQRTEYERGWANGYRQTRLKMARESRIARRS